MGAKGGSGGTKCLAGFTSAFVLKIQKLQINQLKHLAMQCCSD